MTVSPARQLYDLILYPPSGGQIGLMLYRGEPEKRRPAHTQSRFGPSNEQESLVIRDVPIVMNDFSGGFGYSQQWNEVPNTYAWTEGLTCRNPRAVVPAGELTLAASFTGAGRITTAIEYLGLIWWASGAGKVYRSSSGTGTPTLEGTFAASFTSSAYFNGTVYLGSLGGNMWKITSTPQVLELVGIGRDYVCSVFSVTADNVAAYRLWGSNAPSSIRYVSGDPAVGGNWSSSIQVGDTTHLITGLVASNRHVYPLKINGIHDLDELGNSPNLTPYWEQTLDTSAIQVALIQDGYLYATQGRRGLERINLAQGPIRRDAPEWCHPGFGISNETPIQGYPTAIVNEQGWICVAIFNPTNGKSYIMYGKDRRTLNIPGPGPILWHGAEAVLSPSGGDTTAEVTNLHVSVPTSGNPILWISTYEQTSQTTRIYKLDLPKAASPLSDVFFGGSHRFTTSGTLYTSAQDWGAEYSVLKKHVWGYDVRIDNATSPTRDIDVSSNDSGGAYSYEGTAGTSPLTVIGTPSTVPINTEGTSIGLKLDVTAQATSVPILRGIQIRAGVMATQSEYIPGEYEYGEGVPLRDPGMTDRQDAGTVHDALIALQGVTPFTAVDKFGRRLTVRMGQGIEFEDAENSIYGSYRERARFLLRRMV